MDRKEPADLTGSKQTSASRKAEDRSKVNADETTRLGRQVLGCAREIKATGLNPAQLARAQGEIALLAADSADLAQKVLDTTFIKVPGDAISEVAKRATNEWAARTRLRLADIIGRPIRLYEFREAHDAAQSLITKEIAGNGRAKRIAETAKRLRCLHGKPQHPSAIYSLSDIEHLATAKETVWGRLEKAPRWMRQAAVRDRQVLNSAITWWGVRITQSAARASEIVTVEGNAGTTAENPWPSFDHEQRDMLNADLEHWPFADRSPPLIAACACIGTGSRLDTEKKWGCAVRSRERMAGKNEGRRIRP